MATSNSPSLTIRALIVPSAGQTIPASLKAELWEMQGKTNKALKSSISDREGRVLFSFTGRQAEAILRNKEISLYFKVFEGDTLLTDTSQPDNLLFWTNDVGGEELRLHLPKTSIDAPFEETFYVSGMVSLADGKPASGIRICAFDRDLRTEQPLGECVTDKEGNYEIAYFARQIRKQEKGSADLVVKAFGKDAIPLATSPILYNAPQFAEVDLTIPADKIAIASEFEKIGLEITPLLEGIAIVELEEDEKFQDISFLSGEMGISAAQLFRFALAHRLAAQSKIEAPFWYGLLAASFIQIAENQSVDGQLAAVLSALPSLDAAAVRKAMASAFSQNLIPASGKDKVAAWTEAFLDFVARRAVSEASSGIKRALEEAGIIDVKKQEKFSRLLNEQGGFTPMLVEILKKDKSFKAAEIADLQTTFRLADLTQGNFSATRVLKKAAGASQPADVRLLAKKSEKEWTALVRENLKTGDLKLSVELPPIDLPGAEKLRPAEAYGNLLSKQFSDAFPTTAFHGGLERALKNGGSKGLKNAEVFSRFLAMHGDDFELMTTPVDDYFKEKLSPEAKKLAKDDAFRLEVKAVQRVFKLTPNNFEATDTLLADDLHSAQKVYRMGESAFVKKYETASGFTKKAAQDAYYKARDTHAATLTIVGELQALEAEGLPLVLQNGNQAISDFPNWRNLFKSGDLCDCEHCRSVLSPAAYYADLLMFLKDRKAKNPARTVKDILFDRRPDLGWLELNCENALTPLPYIDVVNEVLEAVVADGENDLELMGFTAMPATTAAARTAVLAAFSTENITLGDDFTLSQVDTSDPDRWVVHGDTVTYLLKKKATPNFFAEILRNTKASTAELRANPQYVNPRAYEKLKSSVHPFVLPHNESTATQQSSAVPRYGLPFDLFNEEARAGFQKIQVRRWELMEKLRGASSPNNPTNGEIAAEYFGISVGTAPDEKGIILLADTANQFQYWGETSNANMVANVGVVSMFLQKTGLEYQQMLELLDLKFINPNGDIQVIHLDPTCDTDQKRIQVLDAGKLDRIHRFLRLWRKLNGWKMWELDLCLRHTAIGNGSLDEPFLVKLMRFIEVKNGLGKKVTVEQTLALFGNLNPETRFTKLHEKREDAFYQNLFLNKKLIQPLNPAFAIDPVANDLPAGQTITAHLSTVQAALGAREADLLVFLNLNKASDGLPYIADTLNLANLSFLWRHAFLAKTLKFKAEEWELVLKMLDEDMAAFASPQAAWDFLEKTTRLKNSGFTVDELSWLLSADRSAKAVGKESDTAKALFELRKALQGILRQYDPLQYDFLQATPPVDEAQLEELLTALLQTLGRDDAASSFLIEILQNTVALVAPVAGLPAGFVFPAAITGAPNSIPIRYDEPNSTLQSTGLMTAAQRNILLTDASLAAVTGLAAYQSAINALFDQPRIGVKFYEPIFSAPLEMLPATVDFKSQLDAGLATKISYDAEERLLRFNGLMSQAEQTALDALVPNALPEEVAYHAAVNSLATQPHTIALPDERIWLDYAADLDPALPANDSAAKRMANALNKVLAYLAKTLTEKEVVQYLSDKLGLTTASVRELVTRFQLLPPDTVLALFTGAFSTTTAAIDYAGFKNAFDAFYWLNRVALILKKWKVNTEELQGWLALQAPAQLLDLQSLPLDDVALIAPMENFLRTSTLIKLRDSLPETGITLLEMLQKLNDGDYPAAADFAADVQLMNENWLADDVERFTQTLDLAYPADYLLAENWENRLRPAFGFLEKLNAGVEAALAFVKPALSDLDSAALKQLLRSKFGAETWLALSTEIQDVLRERKRDALAAYLLAQPQPTDAPSGKWENTNDLYAYYLLDVEMSACQLTSRLVQASGSVQLFVQRGHMGLEPDVVVDADGDDGDSAWRWWKWMRKYRVWEANRKVFLWPENWVEPELRKDKSSFFKDLENELLQNEINQFTVETAFQNYLEKLDGVSQLEIANFYHEDDADRTILHLFGRTKGVEPHIYYYRQFDYRRWTPWEKVDLDITGDYLIPAVIGKRLYLFWPVFTEVPDEASNKKMKIPSANDEDFEPTETSKRLKLQMAVSGFRQGKWAPKKISKDFDVSGSYTGEIIKSRYRFWANDRSEIDGRFGIRYEGNSDLKTSYVGLNGTMVNTAANLNGSFELGGCKGMPELAYVPGDFIPALIPERTESQTNQMKWVELRSSTDAPENDFTLTNYFTYYIPNLSDNLQALLGRVPILMQTPNVFRVSPAWHLSWMDKLWSDSPFSIRDKSMILASSWLPFFYADKKRTFFVLPSFKGNNREKLENPEASVRLYYPGIKKMFKEWQDVFEGWVQTILDAINLPIVSDADKLLLGQFLFQQLGLEDRPPYTDETLYDLMKRYYMRSFNFWLGYISHYLHLFRQFHFKNHYHPFVCDFAKLVNNPLKGIPALMSRETQLKESGFVFKNIYQPTPWVVEQPTEQFYPKEVVDFDPDGSYSPYNWELFYHAPLFIANSLSKNQRFEEAMQWYHFMFNPLGVESTMPGGSPMSKYWITKPFFETTDPLYVQQRIDSILRMLAGDTTVGGYTAQLKADLEAAVLDWRDFPFEPHRIAQYRTVAYQKTVVMKYLDNLIAWGDYLFRQDSMESINEATQLYVMAAEILGPKPHKIPPQAKVPVESFNELENQFDDFSNALVQVENLVPVMPGGGDPGDDSAPLPMLYFCIPQNEKLLGYWSTVADRLYKIRHCMNIEGVVRQLALFEPPIDPAALVKAVAGGADLSSALADLNAPLPLYRFNVLLQKANEVCNDVKALGGALLSALEKKDAEALGLLRQGQEIRLLEAVKALRELQIEEAKENLEGVKRSKAVTEMRRNYYRDIEKLISKEKLHLDKMGEAHNLQEAAQGVKLAASIISILPAIDLGASGFGGSPLIKFKIGGLELGQAAGLAADVLSFMSQIASNDSAMASSLASFERRWGEWKFQEQVAEKELLQMEKQIASAELRIKIAERELDNHLLQIENAKSIDEFMRSKYTNVELYQWQVGQISGVYFQCYRLAYDLAKRAERCFRFELGLADSSYISFGHWDSLKKGLLSGEKLQYDLRRLDTAYLEQNRREFELTKHFSLALLDPLALVKLRETGRCFFNLPEEIFDLDYPGHYFRRIKSVSLTLPCIAGPYTTISCTLRMLKNQIRTKTDLADGYAHVTDDAGAPAEDTRFIESNIPVKSIAASTGQNDSGVFELNFRDERYLPFEGAGAISQWSLELFNDVDPDFGRPLRQFDYSTISDAIVHVKYTAREDAGPFKNAAIAHLREYFEADGGTPSVRMFNLRQEFPTQWHRFLNPALGSGNVFELEMKEGLFPFRDAGKALKINSITLLARCTDGGSYSVVLDPPLPAPPPVGSNTFTLAKVNEYGGLHFAKKGLNDLPPFAGISFDPTAPLVTWRLQMTRPGGGNLQEDPVKQVMEVEDLLLVLGYEWE